MIDRRSMLVAGGASLAGLGLGACSPRHIRTLADFREASGHPGGVKVEWIPYFDVSDTRGASDTPVGFMPDVFKAFCKAAEVGASELAIVR